MGSLDAGQFFGLLSHGRLVGLVAIGPALAKLWAHLASIRAHGLSRRPLDLLRSFACRVGNEWEYRCGESLCSLATLFPLGRVLLGLFGRLAPGPLLASLAWSQSGLADERAATMASEVHGAKSALSASSTSQSASHTLEDRPCYVVAGPYLLAPGEPPPDGLSILVMARERVVMDCTGLEMKSPDMMGRLAEVLSYHGANALVDCLSTSPEVISGVPALLVRFSSLGQESRATLVPQFAPPEGRLKLRAFEAPKDPFDWRRPARAAFKILFSLLIAVATAVILVGLMGAVMRHL